jgi:hypothetical protein
VASSLRKHGIKIRGGLISYQSLRRTATICPKPCSAVSIGNSRRTTNR